LYPATKILIELRNCGASYRELEFYMKYKHDPPIPAGYTTIRKYLKKLEADAKKLDEPLY